MQLQESGEMYLETILILSKKLNVVRSIDVADYMKFSKPSVSRAIGILKDAELVQMAPNGQLTLTESGLSIANKIYERHLILTDLLVSYGIDYSTASDDACKIEHVISDQSFTAIKNYLNKK